MSHRKFWEVVEDYMSAAAFAEAGEAETARSFLRPGRTVLLALTPGSKGARSAEYARSVCRRIGAGLEILVWTGGKGQSSFLRNYKKQLSDDRIPWHAENAEGCLRKKILEHTERRGDIHFVVVESSGELDMGCEKDSGLIRKFIDRLRCPLVVVSEARGKA